MSHTNPSSLHGGTFWVLKDPTKPGRGVMYENGRGGLPKDDAQAVSWYRKAADAGNAFGMSRLGFMYEAGRGGLAKDDTQ